MADKSDSPSADPLQQVRTAEDLSAIKNLLIEAVAEYAVFALDQTGHILTWNRGAQRIKGYLPAEIIGKHFSIFYPRADLDAGKPAYELKVAQKEGRFEEEGWRVRKDGTMFWANVVITALFNDEGVLQGFGKVTRDLTARKQAEEALRQSHQRYRFMVDSVEDYAIISLDSKGRIVSWNRGAERLKGYTAKEIVGEHFSIFYPLEDIAADKPGLELKTALSEGRFEDFGWRIKKDGSKFWANVIIWPMRDETGAALGFVKVTRDLSERKRVEELEDIIRLRDDFLSVASHELKTPVTSIYLQLQSLKKISLKLSDTRATEPNEAEQVQLLEAKLHKAIDGSERSTRRLVRLLEELLDVSRIRSGNLKLFYQTVNLTEVAEEIVMQFREEAVRLGCSVELVAGGPVIGAWDRSRLEQILSNLLSNSLKYGERKPVTVSIGIDPRLRVAQIRVSDNGSGIRRI